MMVTQNQHVASVADTK